MILEAWGDASNVAIDYIMQNIGFLLLFNATNLHSNNSSGLTLYFL